MRFESATLTNYKRFTHLTVRGVPDTARLIVLVGPNGCGKSSFIDALWSWYSRARWRMAFHDDYHRKTPDASAVGETPLGFDVSFHDGQVSHNGMHVRTAFRNDSDFRMDHLSQAPDPTEHRRIDRMIDNDTSAGINYQRVAASVFDVFDSPPVMTNEFTDSIIGPVRDPVLRLFPDLELNALANPLKDGTFRFSKGGSRGFPFKNLSGGEKAVFGLILDIVLASKDFDNTIYCIDEPEAHINARLQSRLLVELYQLIPASCQLMIATHSIGMMRAARELEDENPGTVVFLDFGDRDFDASVVIEPTIPDRAFWKRMYHVALDDLASLVAPKRVVICEGEPKTGNKEPNYAHDARCYQSIFDTEFPETEFIPGGNANEVETDKRGLGYALKLVAKDIEVIRLIDRDARSDAEVEDARSDGIRVLSRRNIESYLFDDDVLVALAASVGKQDVVDDLLSSKRDILARSDGPPDNLKPVARDIYVNCIRKLGLTNPGNKTRTFMRDTLAPLVSEVDGLYDELKRDIFG